MAQLGLFEALNGGGLTGDGSLASANPADWPVAGDWRPCIDAFFASAEGLALQAALQQVLDVGAVIFPRNPLRALALTPFAATQVVVLGQDPYPTAGHADGLAFSAAIGRPKSLARIAQVLAADKQGWLPPTHSRLDVWAQQGALLLNTALTVEQGKAGSHLQMGWHSLTGKLLLALARRKNPPVFLLWGSIAQGFADSHLGSAMAALPANLVLRARHPSYDFHKQFMADGSHFLATRERVDWWAWQQLSTCGQPAMFANARVFVQ